MLEDPAAVFGVDAFRVHTPGVTDPDLVAMAQQCLRLRAQRLLMQHSIAERRPGGVGVLRCGRLSHRLRVRQFAKVKGNEDEEKCRPDPRRRQVSCCCVSLASRHVVHSP